MNSRVAIFLAVVAFACFFQGSQAIKCYGCNNATQCALPKEQLGQTECNHSAYNSTCVKNWSGTEIVHRGCYSQGYCQDNANCSECNTDYCNNGRSLILPLFLINALLFLLFRFI